MAMGEVQDDDDDVIYKRSIKKNSVSNKVEVKYILLKKIIRPFSKHKIYELLAFFGSVFPVHVSNLRIYIVNPCILSI